MAALRLPWSSIGVEVHIATWPPYSQSKSWQGTGICVNHIHKAGIRRVQSDRWGHVFKKRSCRVEAAYLVKFCTGAGACICGFLVGLKCKVHPSISSCVSSKAEPDDMRPAPNGSVVENKFHLLDHPCNLSSYQPCVGCCPGISRGSSTISPINQYYVTPIALHKRINSNFFLFW